MVQVDLRVVLLSEYDRLEEQIQSLRTRQVQILVEMEVPRDLIDLENQLNDLLVARARSKDGKYAREAVELHTKLLRIKSQYDSMPTSDVKEEVKETMIRISKRIVEEVFGVRP